MNTENNDGLARAAGVYVTNKKDEYHDLLTLLAQVNNLKPREKWILPILRNNQCKDFKIQLLLAIEDHEEEQK